MFGPFAEDNLKLRGFDSLAGIEPLISGFSLIALIFHNQRNHKNQQSNQRFRQQDESWVQSAHLIAVDTEFLLCVYYTHDIKRSIYVKSQTEYKH